jgi:pimeloyl-ACP methyl ester carboxylesterase
LSSIALAAAPVLDWHGRPQPAAAPGADPWFIRAIGDRPVEQRIDVAGTAIELLTWQAGDGPGLLLVHGAGAHADWWRPTAPQLARAAGRVAAFSFSGTGGSDWRDAYSMDLYAGELIAAAEAAGLFENGRRPLVAAHSFGCIPALLAAEKYGARFSGLVLIDFYLPPPGYPPARPRARKLRRYATLTEGLERFLLAPPQDCPHPFMVDFIARRTLRHVDRPDGTYWTWCTDPASGAPVDHREQRARLAALKVPLTLLRGECSRLVDRVIDAHLREVAPAGTRFIEIPDADHHILLDRPLALVTALRCLLEGS